MTPRLEILCQGRIFLEIFNIALILAKAWDDILNGMGNLLSSALAAVEVSHAFSVVRWLKYNPKS